MIGKNSNKKIVPSHTSIRRSFRFPNKFNLYYKRLHIGTLSFSRNKWHFQYSNDFRNQDTIAPLFAFPEKNIPYKSENLWPFFESRIPSESRIINDNYLNYSDIIQEKVLYRRQALLLRDFGEKTITNPFVLKAF